VSCHRTIPPRPLSARSRGRQIAARTALSAAAATGLLAGSIPLTQLSAAAATAQPHATTQTAAAKARSAKARQARLTAIRLYALHWAEKQAGKWYCWGGTGPSCYDCSGLVVAAYRHAGVDLPRSTFDMLDSGHLREVPASERRPGDLAFYGPGHVELVTSRGTFGALDFGTQLGWHQPSAWWYPTMYFEVK
jgi:cell wall-associated NlpC family hydrolase